MSKSIKFNNNTYVDSTGVVHKRELLSDVLNKQSNNISEQSDIFKFVKYSLGVYLGANSNGSVSMGTLKTITDYTYIGIIPIDNGYGDQWQITYARYGNSVQAYLKSYYGAGLSGNLECMVVYVKTSYYNNHSE